MAKIGTSIRMKSDMLSWIDEKVKERIFATRTHAFEFAIKQLMNRDRIQRN